MSDDKKPKEPIPINPEVAKMLKMVAPVVIEAMKQNIEKLIELQEPYAGYVAARFHALVKKGLTREEALRLCEKM